MQLWNMTGPNKFLGAHQLLPHCWGVLPAHRPAAVTVLYALHRLLQATLVRAGTVMNCPGSTMGTVRPSQGMPVGQGLITRLPKTAGMRSPGAQEGSSWTQGWQPLAAPWEPVELAGASLGISCDLPNG